MTHQNIRHVIRPNLSYLRDFEKLLLTSEDMAKFIQLPRSVVQQLVYSDRIPLPLHLGFGKTARWSLFELLEWD